jgi:WD40 repeat protein
VDALGRPSAELYRGGRLETALEWREAAAPDLTEVEAEFLDASAEAADSDRRALAAEAKRQARQARRLRWALAAAAVLLVAAVAGGLVAVRQRQETNQQRRVAALSALVGDSMALRSNRRDLAALLAVEAHRLAPNAESESALLGTFTAAPGAERIVHTGLSLAVLGTDAAFMPDGRTLVISDERGAIHLIDLETGATDVLPALSERDGWPVFAVAAGGRFLAAGWREHYEPEVGLFTVWDLESREQRFPPVTVDFRIGDIAISADGSAVAVSGGIDMRALIFDGASGAQRAEAERLERPEDATNTVATAALAFAPDGLLAVGSQAGVVRIVDPDTGAEVRRFEGPQESSTSFIGFIDGGRDIVTTGEPNVRYDVASGETRWTSRRPPEESSCNAWAVAERIGKLLCGEYTGRVIAFDLDTGVELGPLLDSQQGDICGLAVSPDGTRVVQVTACQSDDVTIVEWRLDGGGPVSRLVLDPPGERWVNYFGFQGTDALVVDLDVEGEGWRATVVEPVEGEEIASFPGVLTLVPTTDPAVASVVYDDGESPPAFGLFDTRRREPAGPIIEPGIEFGGWWTDGRIALVFDGDSELRTFDLASGRRIEPTIELPERTGINHLEITEDSLYIAVVLGIEEQHPYRVQRRDRSTGVVLAETQDSNYRNLAVRGGVVVGSTNDGRVLELDPTTLEVVGAPFPGTNGPVANMAIDADGRRLIVRAEDATLRFLDIATRTQLGDPIETGRVAGNATIRPDGLSAAAVTDQGIVVWDLDPAHWAEAACELAGRNMTREEWDRYLGDLANYRATCDQYPAAD